MKIAIFAHSWVSDWNHGNAHFLRGWARALQRRGHELLLYEALPDPLGGWSLRNLWEQEQARAAASIREFRASYPELLIRFYALPPKEEPPHLHPALRGTLNGTAQTPWLVHSIEHELRDVELVIVHEWNDLGLWHFLLHLRRRYAFRLLLHDTHHRAFSDPASIRRLPLPELDGVLAFGESIRRIYERDFKVRNSFTLHEAADVDHFKPLSGEQRQQEVVWIGNWGDEERTRELHEYLLRPARALSDARFLVHGVRYPEHARAALDAHGVRYGGYLANLSAARAYARSGLTLHIPRGPYTRGLGGIPTIRVFEALACGIPLLCSPWSDDEKLFQPGEDYLVAASGAEMQAAIADLLRQPQALQALGERGRQTVLARHTCAHRAQQLEEICRHIA